MPFITDSDPLGIAEPQKPPVGTTENKGPYRPVLIQKMVADHTSPVLNITEDPRDQEQLDEEIQRLWLLSCTALLMPLVSFYALYRIVRIQYDVSSTQGHNAMLWVFLVIHLSIVCVTALVCTMYV